MDTPGIKRRMMVAGKAGGPDDRKAAKLAQMPLGWYEVLADYANRLVLARTNAPWKILRVANSEARIENEKDP